MSRRIAELLEHSRMLRQESCALRQRLETNSERAKEVVAVAKETIEFIRMILRELASKRHRQSNA
jgi:hypothetical protein